MTLHKDDRLRIIEEYVAANNEGNVDVASSFCAFTISKMLGCKQSLIVKDVKFLIDSGSLVLRGENLFFKEVIV